MDERTAQMLEKLAQKLGTTTEYLWKILLKQAPIDATVSLFHILGCALFGFILWRIHKKLMKNESDDKYSENLYEKYEIAAALPMIIGLILFAVYLCVSVSTINYIINGYFNSEYWALKEIMNNLR